MHSTVVLGLNCSHDAAAALAVDGQLVAAVSEERLTRIKHKAGFPQRAIDYCLEIAGLRRETARLDCVVINQLPPTNFERHTLDFLSPGAVGELIVNPSHHYLHACYAEMLTERRPLVILVVDGSGYTYAEHLRHGSPLLGPEPAHVDMWEALTAYYVAEDGATSLVRKEWGEWRDHRALRFPSLGHMYGAAAQHVFGSWMHAGKLMGLAPFGDARGLGDRPVVTPTDKGLEIDTDWLIGVPPVTSRRQLETVPLARDIAAKTQAELEKGMMHLCRLLRRETDATALCLTGGVALNSVFNGRLVQEGLFDCVVPTPASSDGGTAIGAAAYAHKKLTGRRLRAPSDVEFLGRSYAPAETTSMLRAQPDVRVETGSGLIKKAADDLAEGKIIGWFEGRSEFGPRALGHRSILADPRGPGMKDRLNSRVKFRESFRPYAAAVLTEHCADWFEQTVESPHMLMVATVKPDKRSQIPAVLHVDDTCRLQTVDARYAGSLRPVIEAFFALTGVPLVLNTSLNIHGEPIAETPRDALDCLTRSGLDVLYCDGHRVEKETPVLGQDDLLLRRPAAIPGLCLMARYEISDPEVPGGEWWAAYGSRQVAITVAEREVLMRVGGDRTVGEIARDIPGETAASVAASVHALCDRGLLSLRPVPVACPETV